MDELINENVNDIEAPILYPGLIDRLKAVFTDYLLIIIFMWIVSSLFSKFDNVPNLVKIGTFVFIFGLYDPVFISLFGGTLGHKAVGLIVKQQQNNNQNLNLPIAIVRNFLKIILGWISLLTIGSSKRKLAVHDMAVGSVVLFKAKKVES